MKTLAQSRHPQRGGFFRASVLIVVAVVIFTFICLIHPVDPRRVEIERLKEEYTKAQAELVDDLVAVSPRDSITTAKKHSSAELALKNLREAIWATPPECVPSQAWKYVMAGQ